MGYFQPPALLRLWTKEELEAALADTSWHQDRDTRYRVRSQFIIDTINEIIAEQQGLRHFAYNAEVFARVREKLGLPRLSDRENAQEGTPLSALVYSAQCYRRSEELVAKGFSAGSEQMLQNAFDTDSKILTQSGDLLKVRKVRDKLYAFRPYKRTRYVDICGYPARIVPKDTKPGQYETIKPAIQVFVRPFVTSP